MTSYADLPDTLARIDAALLAEVRAVREADEQQPDSLDDEDRDLLGRVVRTTAGAAIAKIDHVERDGQNLHVTGHWIDEPQASVVIIDDLHEAVSAALGERAATERKTRDQNRLAAAIRRWLPW